MRITAKTAEDRPGIAAAIVIQASGVLMVLRSVAVGQVSWRFPSGEIETAETPEGLELRNVRHVLERVRGHFVHAVTHSLTLQGPRTL
ncbi:hypothetical protein [Streptomyces sp. NPDC059909]|uniref:hypothetical protein n=1 Tax=Streptomyces sp. NPDC059909 TaxID=3346998 RepID=UPI00366A365C